jgi:hypothetical protein
MSLQSLYLYFLLWALILFGRQFSLFRFGLNGLGGLTGVMHPELPSAQILDFSFAEGLLELCYALPEH